MNCQGRWSYIYFARVSINSPAHIPGSWHADKANFTKVVELPINPLNILRTCDFLNLVNGKRKHLNSNQVVHYLVLLRSSN